MIGGKLDFLSALRKKQSVDSVEERKPVYVSLSEPNDYNKDDEDMKTQFIDKRKSEENNEKYNSFLESLSKTKAKPVLQSLQKVDGDVEAKGVIVLEDDENENDDHDDMKEREAKSDFAQDIVSLVVDVSGNENKIKEEETKLGPEMAVQFGEKYLMKKPDSPANLKLPSYFMNNRKYFVDFMASLMKDIQVSKKEVDCESKEISERTHQQVVEQYLNIFTPYRGSLLFHDFNCAAVAFAEGMKDDRKIVVLTSTQNRATYIEEIKKCGDPLYRTNNYWEFISFAKKDHPFSPESLSKTLNLPEEFLLKQKGAWLINVKKDEPNFEKLSSLEIASLNQQIDEMIQRKYNFINFKELSAKRLREISADKTKNPFDNKIIIVDNASSLASLIAGQSEIHKTLYEFLFSAQNARIIALTKHLVHHSLEEIGILFNILRGQIKTWEIKLDSNSKTNEASLQKMLLGEKSIDYLEFNTENSTLSLTKNPFGFKSFFKKDADISSYNGVEKESASGDEDFERKILTLLKRKNLVSKGSLKVHVYKCLPDTLDEFFHYFVDEKLREPKNLDTFKSRILGLSSAYLNPDSDTFPSFKKQLGVDYHVVKTTMSSTQFQVYKSARLEERKLEQSLTLKHMYSDFYCFSRYFSRLACSYAIVDRPFPSVKAVGGSNDDKNDEKKDDEDDHKKDDEKKDDEDEKNDEKKDDHKKEDNDDKKDDEGFNEVEAAGLHEDASAFIQFLSKQKFASCSKESDDAKHLERVQNSLKQLSDDAPTFLSTVALETYSPKYLKLLQNLKDEDYKGKSVIYSAFNTLEGLPVFSLVLEQNGFSKINVRKSSHGIFELGKTKGKYNYALCTSDLSNDERSVLISIYNSTWDKLDPSLVGELKKIASNNYNGEIIKVLLTDMVLPPLRETKYLHLLEATLDPSTVDQLVDMIWHPCSHQVLNKKDQGCQVFVYLSELSDEQKEDIGDKVDLSFVNKKLETSDQLFYEISVIKSALHQKFAEAIKEAAFDCRLYNNGHCVNFDTSTNKKLEFSYEPSFEKGNKTVAWEGKRVRIGEKDYIYKVNETLNTSKKWLIYDKQSYIEGRPRQVGVLVEDEKGDQVFKIIVPKAPGVLVFDEKEKGSKELEIDEKDDSK